MVLGDADRYDLSDNADGRFTISSETGVVTVAGEIDYEENTMHHIIVTAFVEGSVQSNSIRIAINVNNVNELVLSDEDGRSAAASTKVGAVVSGLDLRANHPDGVPHHRLAT